MNKFYYKFPIVLQHLLTSMYGLKLRRKRYNSLYHQYYTAYNNSKLEPETQLTSLLSHLDKNIKCYRDFDFNDDNKLEVLKKLPITTKDNLREELDLRSSKKGKIMISRTGGTTGKSLKVYSNEYDRASRVAYLDYIKQKHGVKPFSKRASFTGKEITPINHKNILWRYNLPMKQILYASFKLNKDNVHYVYQNMKKHKPVAIDGFPTSIHLLAKYILSNKIEIDWKVKAVFPTAERLTESMKKDIEAAFKTTVVDQYASSEGAPFIYTDNDGKYNIGKETGFFEFYKINENIYEMIVTSFINYATPIVRYKIGDNVQINSNKDYLNSFEDDVEIEKILGRNTDYLIGDNGNLVTSANMSNVVKDLENKIIQSQFIQKSSKDYVINLVVSNNYDFQNDEVLLKEKLNHRLGNNNYYKFHYVTEIPKEKSGKTRFIKNEIGDENK